MINLYVVTSLVICPHMSSSKQPLPYYDHDGNYSDLLLLCTFITWVTIPNGEIRMTTVDKTPGNLIIQSTPIRRVEPSHIESILGFHMTNAAQMTTVYNFDLNKPWNMPLKSVEHPSPAEATYWYWIPISSHYNPITVFTIK